MVSYIWWCTRCIKNDSDVAAGVLDVQYGDGMLVDVAVAVASSAVAVATDAVVEVSIFPT